MNLNDARVQATTKAIRGNFLRLLRQKPVSRITVKEICAMSQINRSTFYKYYTDPLDVLEKLETDVLKKLQENLAHTDFRDMETYLDEILTGIETFGQIYLTLASENGDPTLHAKIFQHCYEAVSPIFDRKYPNLTPRQRQMAYQYYAQGSGGVLSAWIKTGMTEPKETIISLLLQLYN